MALREWHPWQIGAMWVLGLASLALLVRRAGSAWSGTSASGGMSGVSLPWLPTLIAVLILSGMVIVTVRWMRRAG